MIKKKGGSGGAPFTVYEHGRFNGKSQTFKFGKYDCGQFGHLIDKGSSFKVAAGTEVVLY